MQASSPPRSSWSTDTPPRGYTCALFFQRFAAKCLQVLGFKWFAGTTQILNDLARNKTAVGATKTLWSKQTPAEKKKPGADAELLLPLFSVSILAGGA
jgi:hypothetical protein